MKNRDKILERIYRRILKESATPNPGDLGIYVHKMGSGRIVGSIYNVEALEGIIAQRGEEIANLSNISQIARKLAPAIVGYVVIAQPDNPCWDAYEINMIAGPGGIVYRTAYALSPSGLIISDRKEMSAKAQAAWSKMSSTTNRRRKKLDNVNNPQTPEPNDDCQLRKEDYLNYAYVEEGNEKAMLQQMQDNHSEFMTAHQQAYEPTLGEFITELEGYIQAAAANYFFTVTL